MLQNIQIRFEEIVKINYKIFWFKQYLFIHIYRSHMRFILLTHSNMLRRSIWLKNNTFTLKRFYDHKVSWVMSFNLYLGHTLPDLGLHRNMIKLHGLKLIVNTNIQIQKTYIIVSYIILFNVVFELFGEILFYKIGEFLR